MQSIWSNAKCAIKERLPGHCYRMWIEPLELDQCDNEKIILSSPNSFTKKRVIDHYASLIEAEINNVSDQILKLNIQVAKGKTAVSESKGENLCVEPGIKKTKSDSQMMLPNFNTQPKTGRLLQKNYTFDKFVVGKNNDFAYTAALSLASQKQSYQNSLFLLSNTGMGKTHLSQAMGNHILSEYPNERIYYVTAEDFMNEMIGSLHRKSIDGFKEKYRKKCDVLLMEDVHFLTGKDYTQHELAHILDYMFESKKKIIFTSCYLPNEIPKMKDQLRSRLSSGLISNIDAPDFSTRVKILRQKSNDYKFRMPSIVIDYLADQLSENVRQLESGLTGVVAKSSLLGAPIDIDLAESIVKNIAQKQKTITIDVIKKLVCKEFGINVKDMVSKSRKQTVVRPRQVAIYLARRYTTQPLQAIGKSFNRYHATALHSIGTVEKNIKTNTAFEKQISYLSKKLESGKY